MTSYYFIKIWLAILILALIIVATINIVIDPYGIWNSPRIESLNKLKPASANRTRLVKPFQLKNYNIRTLIIGNSRPEIGIDPNSDCWPEEFKPVYNLSIPGARLFYQYQLLQHALHFSSPDRILLAIDFVDFLESDTKNDIIWPPEYKNRGLSKNVDDSYNSSYPLTSLLELLKTTFSLDALSDSIYTIYSQKDKFASNRTSLGFNTAFDYKYIIRAEGQFILFLQKNKEMLQRLQNEHYLFTDNNWSPSFETFKQIIEYSHRKEIEVVVFINPYHTDYLEVIKQTKHWQQFIAWKEKIAELTIEYNVELWDFALVNQYTSEHPPKEGDTKSYLKWFWEPAHFNKDLGDLMLAQILNSVCYNSKKDIAPGMLVNDIKNYRNFLKTQGELNQPITEDSMLRILELLK